MPRRANKEAAACGPGENPGLRAGKLKLVEAMGVAFEGLGVPRAAGRILGWLTVCEPAQQSAAQLAEVLSLSRSSVSTMSRLLITWNFAERIALPGDRKRYLQARPGGWLAASVHELSTWRVLKPSIEALVPLYGEAPAAGRARLDELHAFIRFLDRELPLLFERFTREQAQAPESKAGTPHEAKTQ